MPKKGRLLEYQPYVFALPIVLVMWQWGNDRIPVICELVRRKVDLNYCLANVRFQWMFVRFQRYPWSELNLVVPDAAQVSKADLKLVRQRGTSS